MFCACHDAGTARRYASGMDSQSTYDVTHLFVAVCPEESANAVYLVNPSNDVVGVVDTKIGGRFHTSEGPVDAETQSRRVFIGAFAAVLIEMTSDQEFAAHDVWWDVTYVAAGARTTHRFEAARGLGGARSFRRLPVLDRPGLVVRRVVP